MEEGLEGQGLASIDRRLCFLKGLLIIRLGFLTRHVSKKELYTLNSKLESQLNAGK